MKFKLHKRLVNVVWVSSVITPLSISSMWLKNFQLLRDEDIDNSSSNVGADIVSTDYGWIEIICTPHKVIFQLAKSGHEQMLADLVVSIINLFENAETQGLGVNTYFVYDFSEKEHWDLVGHSLAPKDIWESTNKSVILQDKVQYHFGMRSLVIAIENISRDEKCIYSEAINVTFASSRTIENVNFGLQVSYNHDLTPKKAEDSLSLTKLLPSIVKEQINSALKNDLDTNESIFNRILS